MNEIVNLIVNNSVSVVVVAYFLYMNYKYFDKLTATLTEITITLKDIQEDIKGGVSNDQKKSKNNSRINNNT